MFRILLGMQLIAVCLSATAHARSPLDPNYRIPRATYCEIAASRAYADYVTVASYATAYHTTFRHVIQHSQQLAVAARKAGKLLGGFPNSDLDIMPMHDYVAMINILAGWDEQPEHFRALNEKEFQNHASGFIGEVAPLSEQGPLFQSEIYSQCMKGF